MTLQQSDKPIVAAFDFDGTLTRRDTLFPFLLYVVGPAVFARHMLVLSPVLAAYGLGLMRNDVAKVRVLTRFLRGMNIDALQEKATQFALQELPHLLRNEAMQRLAWHKKQGHRCVVISASLELYVHPWAIKAGFDDVIASHLETQTDGRISGNLAGKNCYGSEKIRRLETLLGPISAYALYAYGDSRGDKELLAAADHAYYRHMPNTLS